MSGTDVERTNPNPHDPGNALPVPLSLEEMKAAMAKDRKYRIGATHGAAWLRQTAKDMAVSGFPAAAISDRLGDLMEVLTDWRNEQRSMPQEGSPWDWSQEELGTYIESHRLLG